MTIILACSACGEQAQTTPARAYQRWQDRVVVATRLPVFGAKPVCATQWVSDENGGYWDELPIDQCVKFDAPLRMHGLWRNDFEGSQLCPAPATDCSFNTPGERIWLDYALPLPGTEPKRFTVQPGGLYAVQFVGRQTKYKGSYGHMGVFDHQVIVDRMISIRELEPPPPPESKAEQISYWKDCEASGNCIPDWDATNKIED